MKQVGSQNQSGILFPIDGEVSELEEELIGLIKTSGKHKNYELVEYVNDVNREYTEVLMELNINGIMDTAYSYGNERLTNERFTGWTRYYSPRTANFLTEDRYLGDIADPLTLNRYNYVKSSPLNYIDPSGITTGEIGDGIARSGMRDGSSWLETAMVLGS